MHTLRRRLADIPLWWIITTALTARIIFGVAPPMLETDYERYFWDGAVVVHGMNPYRYPPMREAWIDAPEGHVAALHALADQAGERFNRINHPHLTTIYPPVAQAAFAVTSLIKPFSVNAWRGVLLVFDALTIVILIQLLRAMSLPAAMVAWWAWNPLLLREVYSSLHMDVLILPFVLLAIFSALRRKPGFAAALCVAASAIKVWPLLLAPIVARPLWGQWWRMLLVAGICAVLATALWSPVLLVEHADESGFVAYGKGWQNNDGFFRAGFWIVDWVRASFGQWHWDPNVIMRAISATLLLSVVLSQFALRPWPIEQLPRRSLIVLGALFMLSPTQFPWYWLWLLPLLVVHPFFPLLLYTALLPLYYVQDVVPAALWIQHLPVWTMIVGTMALRLCRHQKTGSDPTLAQHA